MTGQAKDVFGAIEKGAAVTYKVVHDVNQGVKIIRGDNFKEPGEEDLTHKLADLMQDVPAFIYGWIDGLLQIRLSDQLKVCKAWLPAAEASFTDAIVRFGVLQTKIF